MYVKYELNVNCECLASISIHPSIRLAVRHPLWPRRCLRTHRHCDILRDPHIRRRQFLDARVRPILLDISATNHRRRLSLESRVLTLPATAAAVIREADAVSSRFAVFARVGGQQGAEDGTKLDLEPAPDSRDIGGEEGDEGFATGPGAAVSGA